MEIITNNSDETTIFAEKMAKNIKGSKIILLSGDLGAGKTTFTKGFAKGLGIEEIVTSPTFTLLNEYNSNPKLYHFDMYRLSSKEEAYELGFQDYFNKNDGIIIVEWPENVNGLIPKPYTLIDFKKTSNNSRKIIVTEVKKWTYYV